MEKSEKPSEWVRNHIIVCGVPEWKEPVTAAILDHLGNQKKEKEA